VAVRGALIVLVLTAVLAAAVAVPARVLLALAHLGKVITVVVAAAVTALVAVAERARLGIAAHYTHLPVEETVLPHQLQAHL
jgi:hypothetical protein